MRKGITIRDIIYIIIPALVIAFLLNFVFLVSTVKSSSMEPTLMTGNIVIANRLAYMFSDIKKGDIIVFYDSHTDSLIGKRVIGTNGDEISFKDGYVILNGEILDESDYIGEDVKTICDKSFKVPLGCVFLLGDNREISYDSRYWQYPYIPKNYIIGKEIYQFSYLRFFKSK